ncbi:MAG: hypothetical protein II776_06460 [Clostridia bacterium]|nr:hypothetical protein [Clostridia bacterium]
MKKLGMKNKKLIVAASVVAVLIVASAVVLFILRPWEAKSSEGARKATPIHYYPADYDADIMQNRVYLSYDRDLYFGSQAEERQYHYETDRASASPEAAFFLDYFKALMEGDEEGITRFFVPGYFSEKPHFTMQMIHDMRVLFHSRSTDEIGGETREIYNFTVRYEIFQNNGTWRQGVGSNDARPQIYQLILDEDGAWKIARILDVVYE